MALTSDTKTIQYDFKNIPDEMKQCPHWIVWRAEPNKDNPNKLDKIPYQINGRKAATNNKNHRSTFQEAEQAFSTGKFNGIGFVFSEDDPYIGLDIDNEDLDNLSVKAMSLSALSYTEKSPSGKGLHIIFKGKFPDNANHRKGNFEIYGKGRFFTFTGNVVTDRPILNNQPILNAVVERHFGFKEMPTEEIVDIKPSKIPNAKLWTKMLNSKKGDVIKDLYSGDISTYNNDHSAADQALCNHLAFYTQKNYQQMDSMFRESGLMREKWDQKRGPNTYGHITITKAIEDCNSVYNPERTGSFSLLINDELLGPKVDWRTKLEYGVTKNGDQYLLKNERNIELILENCIADKLAYNEFLQTEVVKSDLAWRKTKPQDEWKDSDISQLLHWFGAKWDISGKDKILNAFVHVVQKRSFHPIKDYLEGTKWDGELRIPYLFHNFLGVDDNPFNREIAIRWFVGAIKRIYQPGCKHDWGIVLVGEKDIGKSWIIQKIAACDSFGELTDFDAKNGGEQLRGKWILEIPELSAKKKSNNEEMKAFMSRQSDDYRAAYARKTESRPRQCVFIGTTNKFEFITDETGDRRNIPLVCHKNHRKMDISNDLNEEFISQLWAEAKVYFVQGKESHLDKQLAEELEIINEIHTLTDPLQDEVLAYVESIHESGRNYLCIREIWDHVVTDDPKKKPTRKDSERIISMLTVLEYERLDKKQRCGEYGVRDSYRRKATSLATKATD